MTVKQSFSQCNVVDEVNAYLAILLIVEKAGFNNFDELDLIAKVLPRNDIFFEQFASFIHAIQTDSAWIGSVEVETVENFFDRMKKFIDSISDDGSRTGDADHESVTSFFDTWNKLEISHDALIRDVAQYSRDAYQKCVDSSPISKKNRKPQVREEENMEESLCLWLASQGIEAERQVSTNQKHRIDVWIPGVTMLELKAQKVTGDDVCQAIDYYNAYRMPITLVGGGLTDSASRGIMAFNKIVPGDMIVFVSWGAAKRYLSDLAKN